MHTTTALRAATWHTNNTVREYVATLEQAMGPMVHLKKHLLAVAFQLAALRDAFAIAWCVWTRSQHPRLAASCSMMQAGCSNPSDPVLAMEEHLMAAASWLAPF